MSYMQSLSTFLATKNKTFKIALIHVHFSSVFGLKSTWVARLGAYLARMCDCVLTSVLNQFAPNKHVSLWEAYLQNRNQKKIRAE